MALLEVRFQTLLKDRVTGRTPTHSPGPYWLGPVPQSWRPHKIGASFATGSGTTPPTSRPDLYGGDVPWVTTSELRETEILATTRCVTSQAVEELPALRVYPQGSVVIALYGATIGRTGVLGLDAAVNQACCVLHRPRFVSLPFVYYWLRAHRTEIAALGAGGGQPNISQETIRSLRVPAPSLSEQELIVSSILADQGSLARLNSELFDSSRLLRERRQALITHAVTHGIEGLPGVA